MGCKTWSRMGKSPLVISPNDWAASASTGADKTALTIAIPPPPPPALGFCPWIRSLNPPQLKKDPLPLAVLSDAKELFVSKMLEMSWSGSTECWHPNRADVVIAPNLHRMFGRGKLVWGKFCLEKADYSLEQLQMSQNRSETKKLSVAQLETRNL